jgi:elongation factor Ts
MEITAQMVKQLRETTGLGMMDCKKALQECAGDMEKAIDFLRTKGKKVAEKRAGRATSEGVIESYIHTGGKLGVLLELNCETDFVARTDAFQSLARELCMQIAAASPEYVSREEVPQDIVERETAVFTAQAQEEGKPEKIIPKIIEGKLNRFFEDICLIDQAFIKDQDKKVKDLLNAAIAETGENIQIARFVRMVLGQ